MEGKVLSYITKGGKYEGEIKNNKKEGYGVEYHFSNNFYKGEWKKG